MGIYSLSYKNLRRKRMRNLSTLLRITFGVLVLTILLSSGIGLNSTVKQVENLTGDVIPHNDSNQNTNVVEIVLNSARDTVNSVFGTQFTSSEFSKNVANLLMNLIYLLDFLASLVFLVGLFGIWNAMNLNMLERKREFGLLKVMGFTENQIILSTILEAGILGLMGAVVGTIVGFGGITFASQVLNFNQLSILIPWYLPPGIIFITTLLSMLIAFYPAWYGCRQDISNSLRYE